MRAAASASVSVSYYPAMLQLFGIAIPQLSSLSLRCNPLMRRCFRMKSELMINTNNNVFFNRSRSLLSASAYSSRNYDDDNDDSGVFTSTSSSSRIIGGDYAGLMATFSSKTGELISVPHHLIPQSMLEWGDIPHCLEMLTSEDWLKNDPTKDVKRSMENKNDNNKDNARTQRMDKDFMRTIITVLPEVGCGIDNLDVTKTVELFRTSSSSSDRLETWEYHIIDDHSMKREVVVADRWHDNNQQQHVLDMETIFQMDSDADGQDDDDSSYCKEGGENGRNSCTTTRPRRIRISCSLDFTNLFKKDNEKQDNIVSPNEITSLLSNNIKLSIERQCSTQSTRGTRWSGQSYNSGGLDARTVMRTIGKSIMNGDVFGQKGKKERGNENTSRKMLYPWMFPNHERISHNINDDGQLSILEGSWTKTMIHPKAANSTGTAVETVHRTKEDFVPTQSPNIVMICLPQNIFIKCWSDLRLTGIESWSVEVSHIDTFMRDDKIHLLRSVISRSFDVQELGYEKKIKKIHGTVCCWIEQKPYHY